MLTKPEIIESTTQFMYLMEEGIAKDYGFTERELDSWLQQLQCEAPHMVTQFCITAQRSGFVTTNIIKSLLASELKKVNCNVTALKFQT